ncbi:MAG TPA: hypothetical protein VJZ27_11160 [Aggregatilineales bacterium]|nr:hypothetical protein [Aggregatilineales bacterium]
MKNLIRSGLILFLVVVLLIPGITAGAQKFTPEQLELIQLVQTGYENLQALQSYHTQGSTNAHQLLSADIQGGYEAELSMDIDFDFDVIPNGVATLDNVNGLTHMVIDVAQNIGGNQHIDAVINFALVDGQSLSRIEESATDLGVPLNVWSAEDPIPATQPIPEDREISEPFLLLYLVTPERVIGVEEKPPSTINGVSVRVVDVELDPAQLRDLRVISLTGIGEENDTNLTATLNGMGALTATTRYLMRVYVGVDDGMPYAAEYLFVNDVTAAQQNGQANQQLEGSVQYSNFNAPVTIVNPLEAGSDSTASTSSGDSNSPVAIVQQAYTDLQSLPGYTSVSQVEGFETLESDGQTLNLQLSVSSSAQVNPRGIDTIDDMIGTATQSASLTQADGTTQAFSSTTEFVLLNEELFSRFDVTPPEMAGALPLGIWVDEATAYPNVGANPPISNDRIWSEPFLFVYLVNADTVDSVTELAASTLDGQQMRVFEIQMNIESLRAAGVITPTSIGEGTSLNMYANFDNMGTITSDAAYLITISIGVDDGLPHLIAFQFTNNVSTARGATADFDIHGTVTYSEYGTPAKIIAPTLGE